MTVLSDTHDTPSGTTEGATIVVDIGGTFTKLGHIVGNTVNQKIERISTDKLRTKKSYPALLNIITTYASSHRLQIDAVVLGIPGLLDPQKETISLCNNIRELEGTGLKNWLSAALDCSVYLEQDTMLQLLGEWRNGAAQKSDAVFGVYFGTGIGAAYLQNGNPFQRSANTLQAGHIPVSNNGKVCMCGNTDCVEAYASGHTLVELAKQHTVPVEQLFLINNNKTLQESLDEFITYQSFLLASIITIAEPQMILIGGGIPKMQGYPHTKLEQSVIAHVQKPFPAEHIKLSWAECEQLAALYGALALIKVTQQSNKA